jgi:hypothetical protein
VLLPDIETAPATMGAGLTPGDAISVEPKGMPVGETVEPVVMPSGEVTPMLGVGLTIALTCALAALQTTSAGRSTAINAVLTRLLCFAMHAWLSDIGEPPWCGELRRSAAADAQIVIQRSVQLPLPRIESRKPFLFGSARRRMRTEILCSRLNVNDRRRGGGRGSCFERTSLGSDV